jgi:hypothetical protein
MTESKIREREEEQPEKDKKLKTKPTPQQFIEYCNKDQPRTSRVSIEHREKFVFQSTFQFVFQSTFQLGR